jgi:uncharacterized membrane protein
MHARRKWSLVACVVLAALAFTPSLACACLQTYQLSPIRIVLSIQLAAVVVSLLVAKPRSRPGWALLAILVIAGSILAAMLAVGLHLTIAALVSVIPVWTVAFFAWRQARRASDGVHHAA